MYRSGFSLIELLVVVALVTILSAIAIPSYNTYIVKARIVELLNVSQTYQLKLLENLYTADNSVQEFILDTATIDRVKVETLATEPALHIVNVTAKMKTATDAGIGIPMQDQPLMLQMQGKSVGEILTWSCHAAPQYHEYVPAQCRNNDMV